MNIARNRIVATIAGLAGVFVLGFSNSASAQAAAPPAINQADTAWMLSPPRWCC